MAAHLQSQEAMLRLIAALSACFFLLVSHESTASACGELECSSFLTTFSVMPAPGQTAQTSSPALAEAGDEAQVRERDRLRLEPKAPAFWMQFRSYAYKQLPKHHEENFTAVWVAMPLSTSDGTVPTLGVKGSWW